MTDEIAHNWLHYHGQLGSQVGRILGPNTMKEYYTVVTQSYDFQKDRTTLGLVLGRINLDG